MSVGKIYHGLRSEGEVKVYVDDRPLKHVVRHSPTGLEWGYGGSGPADLAYSILHDCLGEMASQRLYQPFKWSFVATWHDDWSVSEEEIRSWVKGVEAQ